MFESQSHRRPGPARRAAAYGIDHHQDGSMAWIEKPVHLGGRPSFLDAVLSEIRPHRGDEVFGVGHVLILTARGIRMATSETKAKMGAGAGLGQPFSF